MIWNPLLSVVVYLKTPQILVCGIFDPSSGESVTVGFVYAYNEHIARRNTRFTFFPFFTTHPDYAHLLENAWNSPIIPSSPMISLYQRLRAAKSFC
uniref:Uncharacterized protein n=1 Tax=Brassica oleracea TaxID=3712 RepID=A0A3P6B8A5_BRAOL|nr:unnamed protein product [Brassica oleracea]